MLKAETRREEEGKGRKMDVKNRCKKYVEKEYTAIKRGRREKEY